MVAKGKRVKHRGIFSLLASRNALPEQDLDLDELLSKSSNRQELLDSADSLIRGFIIPRMLKHVGSGHGLNKSDMVLQKTPSGYTFTLGTYTAPVVSSVTINEEIVAVALGSARDHDLVPSGSSRKATFTMIL